MANSLPQTIYKLEKIVDDPRFEGFALPSLPSLLGRESLDDDLVPGYDAESNPAWSQPRIRKKWRPPKVLGRVSAFNDYPCADMFYPVFSERAAETLKSYLGPNGELLPIHVELPVRYFLYNITTISDALDCKRTKGDGWPDLKQTLAIDYYAFRKEKLHGLSIFRLRDCVDGVFVTDAFVRRVNAAGLNGFNFIKIWPLKRGEDYRKQSRTAAQMSGEKLKTQALILVLPLKGAKPSAREKKEISRLESELDAQLIVPSLDAPYFGSYEGSDIVEGEYRMFLTTPDARRLEQKLHPWLLTLKWPSPVAMAKRYGNLHDADAPVEISSIEKLAPFPASAANTNP